MYAVVLLLPLLGSPCEGIVGSVGEETVPCTAVRRTPADSACKEAAKALREVAVRRALKEGTAWPSKSVLERRIDEYVPSKEAVVRDLQLQRERTSALNRALGESEADPTRDRSIWQDLVSPFMPYERWISFRSQMKGRRLADPPKEKDVTLSDEDYTKTRESFTPFVIENLFQEWVKETWAPANGLKKAERFTPELQDRFWSWFLGRTPITRAEALKCATLTAEDLRGPTVQRPAKTPGQSTTKEVQQ